MTKTFAIAAAVVAGFAFAGISAAKADPCQYGGYTQTYKPQTYIQTTHYPVYGTYNTGY